MITSRQSLLLSELRQKPIPEAVLVELLARLQSRIHSMILEAFNRSGLTQTELAERLAWDPARVSRCLGGSSNWTLKTINALMAAIGIDLDDPAYTWFSELERRLQGTFYVTDVPVPNKLNTDVLQIPMTNRRVYISHQRHATAVGGSKLSQHFQQKVELIDKYRASIEPITSFAQIDGDLRRANQR
jgi:hypothetical protein